MTTILAALENSLLVIDSTKDGWTTCEHLKGYSIQTIAFDPQNRSRAYCGTWDNGLWKTDDNGQTWDKVPIEFPGFNIVSLSVSSIESGKKGFNRVFVGTEPSAIFTSIDGIVTCHKMDSFNNLTSSSSWAFPPRPWTHHVRWIEPDKSNSGYLFVAIEAGALIQSRDGGKTWLDRVGSGPYDTHTLRTHKMAPGRLYSAAGDGYFESYDYGETWNRFMEGLEHGYLYGLAVNPSDPQNVVVSASRDWNTHSVENAESVLYKRSADGEKWDLIGEGIFNSKGTIISNLTANSDVKGEFYCLNNRGIFCSVDSGLSWEPLEIPWPKEYYLQHP